MVGHELFMDGYEVAKFCNKKILQKKRLLL